MGKNGNNHTENRVRGRENYRNSKLWRLLHHDKELYAKIMDDIANGAYANVASQALGIGYRTYCRWLKHGREDIQEGKDDTHYARFYKDLQEAHAKARRQAEQEVFKTDPKFWLTRGPGRARDTQEIDEDGVPLPLEDGWSDGAVGGNNVLHIHNNVVVEDTASNDEIRESIEVLRQCLPPGTMDQESIDGSA